MPIAKVLIFALGVIFWLWTYIVFNRKLSHRFTTWWGATESRNRDIIRWLSRQGDASPYYPTATLKVTGVLTAVLGLVFVLVGLFG